MSIRPAGFKRDLNAYFAAHVSPFAPVTSLQDVIDHNIAHASDIPSSIKYGQTIALFSQMFDLTPGSSDTLRYERPMQYRVPPPTTPALAGDTVIRP